MVLFLNNFEIIFFFNICRLRLIDIKFTREGVKNSIGKVRIEVEERFKDIK